VETGVGISGTLTGKDFFAQTRLDLSACATPAESDSALAALLLRYLRHRYDTRQGSWPGQDGRDTLRQTCHAAEVLHQLNFDHSSADMVYTAGNWLINLDIAYVLPASERAHVRLYPSRFKTLAYLGRFDDEQVRRDFAELLDGERDGLIGDPVGPAAGSERGDDSAIQRTCIALDTLLTLERQGLRRDVCDDERYQIIVDALRQRLRAWQPGTSGVGPATPSANGRGRNGHSPVATPITSYRDLSYALGLLCSSGRRGLTARVIEPIVTVLVRAITQRDRARFGDLTNILYPALQLAEHFRSEGRVQEAVRGLLDDLRDAYIEAETPRRWELTHHVLVLRLLLACYTPPVLARGVAARLLTETERHERIALESDLEAVIRDRIQIGLSGIRSLSGGFTEDQVLHVQFRYWFPNGAHQSDRALPPTAPEASLILKRSTSSAFHTATTNYGRLPTDLHQYFIRQPSNAEIYKSQHSTAYYLPMEDLTNLVTFRDFFDELDQRAMSPQQVHLLDQATEHIAAASFTLFRQTQAVHAGFAGPQIARLYLSRIENALVRAISRIPWLKTALDGYLVAGQRYRAMESYLGLVTRHAHALQPGALGLVHGDFHARNIMLDRQATQVKLIDLDKLSWTGDYLTDLSNLLVDVAIYRRLVEPDRGFGLTAESITFVASAQAEKGTAENAIHYPALGRPATMTFQMRLLEQIGGFAMELDDRTWKPRLWLAAATALLFRIGHHTERDIAAVLYGEAVRLLHELGRSLEGGQLLPAVLVPDAWPAPLAGRILAGGELPEWLASSDSLRQVHDGLRAIGLRAEIERGSVRYHGDQPPDGPAAVMVRARSEGTARLMLRPARMRKLPRTSLELVTTTTAEGEIATLAVIVPASAEAQEVLRIARACLGSA
jgi:hypothetical protein